MPRMYEVDVTDMIKLCVRIKTEVQEGHKFQVRFLSDQARFFLELTYGTLAERFACFQFTTEAVPFRYAKAPLFTAQKEFSCGVNGKT